MQMGEPRLNPTLNRLFLLSMFYFFKPPPKYLTLIVCVCVSVHIHGHNDMLSVVMFLIYSDLGDFFFFSVTPPLPYLKISTVRKVIF